MITLRSNNYANLLQFRSRKNSKKTESDNTVPEHKTRHSANNKYTTGIIATSAFIAGLGANKLLVPTESMANTKTEMYAPARNNTEEASSTDISWEDATAQQRPQQRRTTTPQKTRPANSDYWYYTKRNTVTGENGEKYTEISQYVVHEQQDLLTKTYKNAQGKVIQKEEYNRYVSVHLKEKTTLENGKLYQEKEYEKFNYNSKTPTKGYIKVARDDGSTDTYDVDFKIQMQLNKNKHTNPPQKQQQNNNSTGTGFGDAFYDQIFGN